jgi:hypothetical protein
MHPAIENANLEPPEPGFVWVRGLPFAVIAHVALAVALTWGVQWKSQPDALSTIPLSPDTGAMGAAPAPAEPDQREAEAAGR